MDWQTDVLAVLPRMIYLGGCQSSSIVISWLLSGSVYTTLG